jgi:hypothetical protein
MTRRNECHDVKAAAAQAAQLVTQRLTCEGCSALRGVRPMCQSEASPHYRQPRHAGNDRCGVYAVKGAAPKAVAPETEPASRAKIAGEVAKRKHNRWERRSA